MNAEKPISTRMDSSESPVYGEQEQIAYNGYFGLAGKLRPGNVHSAEGWEELLLAEIQGRRHEPSRILPLLIRCCGGGLWG